MIEAQRAYIKMFGEAFPLFYFARLPDEEVISMIWKCIESGKNAFDIGYINISDGVEY